MPEAKIACARCAQDSSCTWPSPCSRRSWSRWWPAWRRAAADRLYATGKKQDHQDQHDEPHTAARSIAPPPAVRPGRDDSQERQNEDHDEDAQHFGSLPLTLLE